MRIKAERCFVFLLVALTLISNCLYAQQFEISNYNSEHNLPGDYIYSMAQDTSGYLWVGTEAGLSKYDGKTFRNYYKKDGLAEDFVKVIYRDKQHKIWLGHYEGGISFIQNGKIKRIAKPAGNTSPVNSIVADSQGIVWIATQSDGIVMVKDEKVFSFKNDSTLSSISSIAELSENSFLIGTDRGLITAKLKDNNLTIDKAFLEESTPVLQIIKKKQKNEFWIVTREGLWDFSSGSLKERISFPSDFPFDKINAVLKVQTSSLYVATQGLGVYKVNIENGKAEIEEHINADNGLNSNFIKALFIDREYNVWLGSYGAGLSKIEYPQFKTYSFPALQHSKIKALSNDKEQVWVASEKSLTLIDTKAGKLVKSIPIETGIGEISCMEINKSGEILIGTESNGIYLLNPSSQSFQKFFLIDEFPLANKIMDLYNDASGNTWAATYNGAYLLDSSSKILKHLTIRDGLLHNVVKLVFNDKDNNIWIVAEGSGISKYLNDSLETFKFKGETNFNVNCITQDGTGRFWLGTDGGGIFVFGKDRTIRSIVKGRGLLPDYCSGIICDKNNNIWISHSQGITKFTPSSKRTVEFKKINGLAVTSLHNNLTGRNDEEVYFATDGGLIRHTSPIDALVAKHPVLQINQVELFFDKVDWKNYTDSVYGETNLPFDLTLKHNENHLNFRFTAVTLRSPENVIYKYKLQGFDQKWSLPSNQDFATYANLPPGDYTFMVSAESDGVSTNYQYISFEISNPYWKTWWFLLLTTSAAALIIGAIFYLRIRNLKEKQLSLEQQRSALREEIKVRRIAEQKMIESESKLKAVNDKLLKSNKELSTFIYRSSHDLKGPLMSIAGLTMLGKMESQDENIDGYFSKIADETNRLDGILKVLSRVTEIKDCVIEIKPINFNELIRQVLEELKTTYDTSVIKCQVKLTRSFCSDYDLILTILKALLDNCFKYKRNRTELTILILVEEHKNGIRLSVQDNGMGISPVVMPRIFDMFFKGTESSTGFGLGLYVVSNCVERLGGSYTVNSTENRGTSVDIYL